jgi:hypothetical protein
MRGREGALLTVLAGLGCVVLAASVLPRPVIPAASAAPPTGQPRPAAIDWDAARRQAGSDAHDRGRALAGALAGAKGQMARITIPVLLPTEPDLVENLRVFANGAFYSASASSRGMTFMLTGSASAFPVGPATARALPGASLASRVAPDGVSVGKTEAGFEASFGRFGAAYSITLDCARPDDRRCNDAAYLRGVISRLAVVIPAGAG